MANAARHFFVSLPEEVHPMLLNLIGSLKKKPGRKPGHTTRPISEAQTLRNRQQTTMSSNEKARLMAMMVDENHAELWEQYNHVLPNREALDANATGGGASYQSVLKQLADIFFNTTDFNYPSEAKQSAMKPELWARLKDVNPNDIQGRRPDLDAGQWLKTEMKRVYSMLSYHWSAFDVSGQQMDFDADSWLAFEPGHNGALKGAVQADGTNRASTTQSCCAACLYAPVLCPDKEEFMRTFTSQKTFHVMETGTTGTKRGRGNGSNSPAIHQLLQSAERNAQLQERLINTLVASHSSNSSTAQVLDGTLDAEQIALYTQVSALSTQSRNLHEHKGEEDDETDEILSDTLKGLEALLDNHTPSLLLSGMYLELTNHFDSTIRRIGAKCNLAAITSSR
jgi:hypothetical protein